jgi:hypothetical protein
VQLCNLGSSIPYPKLAPAGADVITTYRVGSGYRAQRTRPDSTAVWPVNGIRVNVPDPPSTATTQLVPAHDGNVAAFWVSDNSDICAAIVRPASSSSVDRPAGKSFDLLFDPSSDQILLTLPPHRGDVRISVIDMKGREVIDRMVDADVGMLRLNSNGLARGVYLVRLISGDELRVRKLLVR